MTLFFPIVNMLSGFNFTFKMVLDFPEKKYTNKLSLDLFFAKSPKLPYFESDISILPSAGHINRMNFSILTIYNCDKIKKNYF